MLLMFLHLLDSSPSGIVVDIFKQLFSGPSKTGLKKRIGKGCYGNVCGCFPAPSSTPEEEVSAQLFSSVFFEAASGSGRAFCRKCGLLLRGGQGGLGAIHSKGQELQELE